MTDPYDQQAVEERLLAYQSLSAARERLYVCHTRSNGEGGSQTGSVIVSELNRLFPHCIRFDADEEDALARVEGESPAFYSPPPDGERAIRSPPRSSAILPLARIMPAGLPGLAAPPAIRLRVLKTPKIPVGYLAISFISPLPVWRYIINAGFNIFAATASMRGRARLQSSTL